MEQASPALQLLARYYTHVLPCSDFIARRVAGDEEAGRLKSALEERPEVRACLEGLVLCCDVFPENPTMPYEPPRCSQPEILHTVLDILLRRAQKGTKNILALGYTRGHDRNAAAHVGPHGASIVNDFPNSQVATLTTGLWQNILQTIGETLMIEILCNTSLYVSLGNDCYQQLTGDCLGDVFPQKEFALKKRKRDTADVQTLTNKRQKYGKYKLRTNHEVTLVRSRLFYSRPTLNSKGNVNFGLRHIHVLNRISKLRSGERINQLMIHMFPLQYRLHNVFSSFTDRRQTVQPFKDYTMRDDIPVPAPSRAKSLPRALAPVLDELQDRHDRCSYSELLNYYCSKGITSFSEISTSNLSMSLGKRFWTQSAGQTSIETSADAEPHKDLLQFRKEVFTNYSTSPADVAAFVTAVMHSVLPVSLVGRNNLTNLVRHISRFIALRRYESLSLGHFMHLLKYKEVPWMISGRAKHSLSETRKKEELLSELVYWILDSFVLPLLRSHFYITESHMFRNRVLYFRHDVWKKLVEPELSRLRLSMLSEVPAFLASEVLKSRSLGFAYLRLLPKGSGARPITNLRRRDTSKDGTKRTRVGYLLPSINSVLQSVYNVLLHEGKANPNRLGFSIQSVDEMHRRIKEYRKTLSKLKHTGKLYFAKVDVKSCFDTIDQEKLLEIVADVLAEDDYMLQKFCVLVPSLGKISRKYHNRAIPAQDMESFGDFAATYTRKKQHTVLVDGVVYQFRERDQILTLLKEHLNMHLIKIGKKFFRQDTGIPQGSILSSILCNLYYAHMEASTLSCAHRADSICFRLIDDFLFITPHRPSAENFLQIMHEGNPEYGCFVGSDKTLTNFDIVICGQRVSTLAGSLEFPYCGTTINTTTLEVRKDFSRAPTLVVSDTLTIDHTRNPGSGIMPKVFQGLKLSCQSLYIDTAFNSIHTVLLNIYRSLVFSAMRYHVFLKCLRQSGSTLQARSFEFVKELVELLFVFLKSRGRPSNTVQCSVTQAQISWLGCHAYFYVLQRRPAGYGETLSRLSRALQETCKRPRDRKLLLKVVKPANVECFADFGY